MQATLARALLESAIVRRETKRIADCDGKPAFSRCTVHFFAVQLADRMNLNQAEHLYV